MLELVNAVVKINSTSEQFNAKSCKLKSFSYGFFAFVDTGECEKIIKISNFEIKDNMLILFDIQ